MHVVDHAHILPPLLHAQYMNELVGLVRSHSIALAFPLLDSELPALADARSRFEDCGCRLVISSPDVILACRDKLLTFQALRAGGIDTPETWTLESSLAKRRHRFPYFLKPRYGSAGTSSYKVTNLDELRVLGGRVPQAIVQEFVEGLEHTLDVYTGFDGLTRCVVPRKRLEIRGGEVSKGLIVKDKKIVAMGRAVADVLRGCRGVITVQCIVTPRGRIRVIEINPRFGGGVPLAIHAGADFPRWLLAEHLGRRVRITADSFQAGVAMLRYDSSVFCKLNSRATK